ncbi:MAG: hypothetical protein R3Y63_05105, partial [Eubacteriales bacterium]
TTEDTTVEDTTEDTTVEDTTEDTTVEDTTEDTTVEDTTEDTTVEDTTEDTTVEDTTEDTTVEDTTEDTTVEDTTEDTTVEDTTEDTTVEDAPSTQNLYDMPGDTNQDGVISISELDAVFASFRSEYPQGTNWTNSNSYGTVRYTLSDSGDISRVNLTAAGCAGWTYMLEDAIYGNAPQYEISRSEVQAGDFWHTGSHWGVVMSVSGNDFITTEGNYNSSIYWDVTRTTSYLTDSVTYYSRRPI